MVKEYRTVPKEGPEILPAVLARKSGWRKATASEELTARRRITFRSSIRR